MKLWFRKVSVTLIAIMTLGLYIPPSYLPTEAKENEDVIVSKTDKDDTVFLSITDINEKEIDTIEEIKSNELNLDDEYFTKTITEIAKDQMTIKVGPKIINQVEDEFMTIILPAMETVLKEILSGAGEENVTYYGITEQPGNGERAFNIYDYRTNKDIARFHVRRDNRPLEGYWFNFHYHLSNDNFEEHHEIGEIYWNKNIPPKWMS